jgi:hypothetical protein
LQTTLPVATVTLDFEDLVAADAFAPANIEEVERTTMNTADNVPTRELQLDPPMPERLTSPVSTTASKWVRAIGP